MDIEELLKDDGISADEKIGILSDKKVSVPKWGGRGGLKEQYEPDLHPVMDRALYPDIVREDGEVERVTRITYAMQKLAVKRMTELVTGIPPKRLYRPKNPKEQEVASIMESVFKRTRIDSVNVERLNLLYSGCEFATIWYMVERPNAIYGFNSPVRFRCRNFSPVYGHSIYPLFDEYGDMVALSVKYKGAKDGRDAWYFDTYTSSMHLGWVNNGKGWELLENEDITTVGKIPAVYCMRPFPIWEDTSKIVYEMEWAVSRNGNYLRKNSKPIFVVFADEAINYGDEKDEKREFRTVAQYPKGSSAQYVTWAQAIDNLKFYITELRQSFFTQLQLPDWSYESMKSNPMSGESRKQLFIDAQLKVKDESGRLIEAFDRECNVVKALLKTVLSGDMHDAVDSLQIDNVITPFTITDEKDNIANIMAATGGKAIASRREGVERLGWSDDIDGTLREIADEEMADALEPTI